MLGNKSDLVTGALTPFLKDPDEQTRVDAAIALANLGQVDTGTIPTLIEAMGNPREDVRKVVVRALVRIGRESPEKTLPALTENITSKKANVAKESLIILRRMAIKAKPALPKIIESFDDIEPRNRWRALAAAVAIDRRGDEIVGLLQKGLKDEDPETRREALFGLLRMRNKLDDPVQPFLAALDDPDESNLMSAISMIRALGSKISLAEPKLLELTKHEDDMVRRASIQTLSAIKPASEKAIDALSQALNDPDQKVRMAAVSSLSSIGVNDPKAVLKILEKASSSEQPEKVKSYIARTVQRLERRAQYLDNKADKKKQ